MSIPILLGLYVALILQEASFWMPTVLVGLFLFTAMLIFKTTRLVLTKDTIHYRSLFTVRDIQLADIVSADFLIGRQGFNYKPYQRIEIIVREGAKQKEITINAGLFDRVELRPWLKELQSRLSHRGIKEDATL